MKEIKIAEIIVSSDNKRTEVILSDGSRLVGLTKVVCEKGANTQAAFHIEGLLYERDIEENKELHGVRTPKRANKKAQGESA